MLDVIVPVERDPRGPGVSTRGDGLPAELLACGELGVREDIRTLVRCPCCSESAPRLRVGWMFAAHGVLFLRAAATYCPTTRRVFLAAPDVGALATRSGRLRTDTVRPALPVPVGVRTALRRDRVGASVVAALGGDVGALRYASAADAVLVPGVAASLPDGALPDHVVFHSTELPEHLTLKLEPTTRCNFDCGFCYGRHIEQGSLAWDDFARILDAIPGVRAVELTGEGEPLVHTRIYDFVAECHRRGMQTHVTTNGSLLTEAAAVRLLEAGLSSLAVSLESIDPECFARLRPGGDLATVLEAVARFHRLRAQRRSEVGLELWVSVLRETVHELDAIRRRAADLGVDAVWFQCLNPMHAYRRFYDERLERNVLSEDEISRLAEDPATPEGALGALRQTLEPFQGTTCDIFTHTVSVTWQGHVTPCCLLKVPAFLPLGTLTREPFEAVWNRARSRRFRFALEHGIVLPSCRDCPDVARA